MLVLDSEAGRTNPFAEDCWLEESPDGEVTSSSQWQLDLVALGAT